MKRAGKHERELIDRWIEQNPRKPWEAEARIVTTGTSVWALVGYSPAVDDDLGRIAADYGLPEEAVQAAFAYYRLHRQAIDCRLAENAAYSAL